mmetsp:Transcript_70186/g.177995  ORF Transcript_70186/g.177995 Transcript_70186/m.177995 type:complete len:89 (-) Transcript_70186:73-339(-)
MSPVTVSDLVRCWQTDGPCGRRRFFGCGCNAVERAESGRVWAKLILLHVETVQHGQRGSKLSTGASSIFIRILQEFTLLGRLALGGAT